MTQMKMIDPHGEDNPAALHKKALTFIQNNQVNLAVKTLERAAKLAPGNSQIALNLGKAYLLKNEQTKAEGAYKRALEIDENFAPALIAMGTLLGQTKRAAEAVKYLERATEQSPENPLAWNNLVTYLEFTGALDKATAAITEACKQPNHDIAIIGLVEAKIKRRQGKLEEAAKILEDAIKSSRQSPSTLHLYYLLGKVYDALGRTVEAFSCFEKANNLLAQTKAAQKIDRSTLPARIEKNLKMFDSNFVSSWSETPVLKENSPVFLVGFPRSGTTLLDQILSSHPDVTVAEEVPALANVRIELDEDYPENLAELDTKKIEELRSLYFSSHDKPETPVFIDKMPLNIHDAGLIHRLFPESKIILAQRHPCDCVLSCFMQEFSLNLSMVHFLDLHDAAHLYDKTFSLWERYNEVLPLQVHNIRYEDVVTDFKPTVAALLEFLGLPWNDAVLEYDKTAQEKTEIKTPSYHQVTEKIYDSARYRWLRYKKQLGPVMPLLQPWMEKYGYETG